MRHLRHQSSRLSRSFIAALIAGGTLAGCSSTGASTASQSPTVTSTSPSAAPMPSGAGCAAAEKTNNQQVVDALTKAEAAHAAWAVYQGGADDDWATYYSAFLVEKSPLAQLIDTPLTQSSVTSALVTLDREYSAQSPSTSWQEWYALHLCEALPSGD